MIISISIGTIPIQYMYNCKYNGFVKAFHHRLCSDECFEPFHIHDIKGLDRLCQQLHCYFYDLTYDRNRLVNYKLPSLDNLLYRISRYDTQCVFNFN